MLWSGIGTLLMLEERQLHMEMELTVHLPKTVPRGRLSQSVSEPHGCAQQVRTGYLVLQRGIHVICHELMTQLIKRNN